MKKISKKQKLIITISTVLLLIILTIIITCNIMSKSSNLASGGYFATTANASSKIVASYIKKGITIGGVTGTLEVLDTSDATATLENIDYGKTAYVNGGKITGTKISGSNYEFKDSLGNVVKVPAGFKVVNPENNVTEGIIIEDVNAGDENTKGSQFVWIPVGDVITNTSGSTTKIELGRYSFDSNGKEKLVQLAENWNDTSNSVAINTYNKELATSSYGNVTAKNLENFATETLASGGYYIGRYEAGDATAINSPHTSSATTYQIACKSGIYPYNYVIQSEASALAKGMYRNSNFDSDLINSYAWDTAIVFIQTFSGDTDYSRQIRLQSTLAKCGEATDGTNKDVRCNIYDMAGNTREWSTETYLNTSYPCGIRGGFYNNTDGFVSTRGGETTYRRYDYYSFRPILYL